MTFPSSIAYDFVYLTGNAFQAFLTRDDQNLLLENVNKLLKPGWKFIFETRNPSSHDLTDCDYDYWHTFQDYEGNPVEVGGKQKYNPDTNIMKWTTIRKFQSYERESDILCLFTEPESIRKLSNEHGFDVQSRKTSMTLSAQTWYEYGR